MSNVSVIELPWPPKVPKRLDIKSPESLAFFQVVGEEVLRQRLNIMHNGVVHIRVIVFPPDRRKRDYWVLGNLIVQALKHANVFVDERQVVEFALESRCPRLPGKILIQLKFVDKDFGEWYKDCAKDGRRRVAV